MVILEFGKCINRQMSVVVNSTKKQLKIYFHRKILKLFFKYYQHKMLLFTVMLCFVFLFDEQYTIIILEFT